MVLRLNNAGLHYLVASVQFSNGTAGIYSSVVNVEPDQSSKSNSDYWFEQEQDKGTGFNIIEPLDIGNIMENPTFYQKSSALICSHLSFYGFKICEEGIQSDPNNESLNSFPVGESNIGGDNSDDDSD